MIVIGLDCLEPSLAFDRWAESMPNLTRLRRRGVYARMRSSIPPITIPAWQCMMTGKDPGSLGLYGFRNRKDYTYTGLTFADGKMVRAKRIWDYLSRKGKKNILLGVPQTYPPRPLNGVMVSGFPLPDPSGVYTYPAALKKEILDVVDYIPDVEEFRTENKQAVLDRLIEMTMRRFKLAGYLLEAKPWDFFMMVEIGTDRIVHLLWRYTDETHRRYVPGHPLRRAIQDYYALCDRLLGELIAPYESDPGTAVAVVSDHGARGMRGGICINEWLIRNGYLVLRKRPEAPTGMTGVIREGLVDWSRTRVWAEGGYYSRIMFNVKGREPEGIIDESGIPDLLGEITSGLESITDEQGQALDTLVYPPHTLYHEVRNIPPDLIVIFDNLGWRAVGTVQPEDDTPLHVFENDTGPDDANHDWHGAFVMAGGGVSAAGELEPFSLLDFAPTVLSYFDHDIPPDLQGRALPITDRSL